MGCFEGILDEVPLESIRIGSWVLDGVDEAQVTGMTCDGIVDTTYRSRSNVELLSAIPVTREFFEGNGFTWVSDNHSYLLSRDGWKIVVYVHGEWDDGEIQTCDLWCGDPSRFCQIRLRFVHELQNALELCGIRLGLKV